MTPVSLVASTLRLATPYLYASLGETIGQRSGVLNLGVDGVMLMGAYAAFYVSLKTGSALLGLLVAMLVGLALGLLMSWVSVSLRAEQGLSGMGLYFLGLGLSSLLFEVQVRRVIQCPDLPGIEWGAYLLIPITWWLLERTRFGLRLKAVGENPEAARAAGISVGTTRYLAVCLGCLLAAVGGASLSIGLLNLFQEQMTGGIGFIAVALVYFGGWSTGGVVLGALLFAGLNSLQLWAQVENLGISSDLAVALPYLLTVVALVVSPTRRREPAALAVPLEGRPARPSPRRRWRLALLTGLTVLLIFGPQRSAQVGPEGATLKVAAILPGVVQDLSWSQSLVDALDRLKASTPGLYVAVLESQGNVSDAIASARSYAGQGYDLVILHGSQYTQSLFEVARDFPEVSFAWGTGVDTGGLPNVFAYNPEAQQGGYLQGLLAARLTRTGVVGMVGPIEAGDAKAYIDGFRQGLEAGRPGARLNVTFTGSFGDTTLASNAASIQIQAGADVLSGSAQQVAGAIALVRAHNLKWLGTQWDQTELAPEQVVACQIYDFEPMLRQILELRRQGRKGGRSLIMTLANGGLKLNYNPKLELPLELREELSRATRGICEGTLQVHD